MKNDLEREYTPIRVKQRFRWSRITELRYVLHFILFTRRIKVVRETNSYKYQEDLRLLSKILLLPFVILGNVYLGIKNWIYGLKFSGSETVSGKYEPEMFDELFKEVRRR